MPSQSDSTLTCSTQCTVCARCAAQGPTCCRMDPAGSGVCFPVSVMEWERILDVVGDTQGAFIQEANSVPFLEAMRRLFPGERRAVEVLFPAHKFHLRVATTAAGACVFLGARGCGLPREARPYYCRLFPFWMQGDRVTLLDAGGLHSAGCLALREGWRKDEALHLLQMRERDVRTLHGRLRLAWGLPPRPGLPVPPPSFARSRK